MRGEVMHYDEGQGFGFIAAADGQRYTFRREDIRRDGTVATGTTVEFTLVGGQAKEVFAVRAGLGQAPAAPGGTAGASAPVAQAPAAWPQPAAAQTAHPSFGRLAHSAPASGTGLWSYFRAGLTANYANFRGRARRKEYWGYYLFWTIAVMVLGAGGIILDGSLGNLAPGGPGPIFTFGAVGLFVVATIPPSIAMAVRRQHDIGLSGWFYLLVLLPSVGSLILFVFALIPSQLHDNKWGPVPAGIPIPPPYGRPPAA